MDCVRNEEALKKLLACANDFCNETLPPAPWGIGCCSHPFSIIHPSQTMPITGLDLPGPALPRVLDKAAFMALQDLRISTLGQAIRPNIWDIVALILVIGAMVLIVYGGEQTTAPLSTLDVTPVSLDPSNLPLYALRTTMRML